MIYASLDEIIDATGEDTKVLTNADRIRAMSDEELAREYALTGCPRIPDDDVCDSFGDKYTCCYNCWLDWLRQPVKDGDNNGM